jgi:hypothetical protein
MWGNSFKLFCVEKLWSMDLILRNADNFYIFFHDCSVGGCAWKFMPGMWITRTCHTINVQCNSVANKLKMTQFC